MCVCGALEVGIISSFNILNLLKKIWKDFI